MCPPTCPLYTIPKCTLLLNESETCTIFVRLRVRFVGHERLSTAQNVCRRLLATYNEVIEKG